METYSRLWGKSGGADVWLGALAATLVCAAIARREIHFMVPVLAALMLVLLLALSMIPAYLRGSLAGKNIEMISAVWTLTLYLMLGLVPLFAHWLG